MLISNTAGSPLSAACKWTIHAKVCVTKWREENWIGATMFGTTNQTALRNHLHKRFTGHHGSKASQRRFSHCSLSKMHLPAISDCLCYLAAPPLHPYSLWALMLELHDFPQLHLNPGLPSPRHLLAISNLPWPRFPQQRKALLSRRMSPQMSSLSPTVLPSL